MSDSPMIDPLTQPDDAARFGLRLALRIAATLHPEENVGPCPDGDRRNYPIAGGRFWGPGLSGAVIGSGADMAFVRADHICVVDALYRIRTDDGVVIIVQNQGLYEDPEFSPRGRKYLVTRPVFTAPDGKYDWLNRSLFIGTVDDSADGVLVSVYEATI